MEDIKTIEMVFVNAFLIKVKEGFVLIDTGLSMHREKLESELISSGCFPDKLKLVIVTHGDFDHTGNCARLREKYGCRIAMHKEDSLMVESGLSLKRKSRTFQSRIFFLIRILLRKKFTFDKFKPDIYLTEGQKLNEFGFNAEVIHIPGHTKGSIGILTGEGNLFAGDTFTNRRKPEKAILIENPADLENSLKRLQKMEIRMIYPGHGKPFKPDQLTW
jgi:glyoxylase-like metal-dependent hydrolase (beta-lactamase superfamily II)